MAPDPGPGSLPPQAVTSAPLVPSLTNQVKVDQCAVALIKKQWRIVQDLSFAGEERGSFECCVKLFCWKFDTHHPLVTLDSFFS